MNKLELRNLIREEVRKTLNEDETLIFDELGTDLTSLQDQIITMLGWKITDPKWTNALLAIQNDLDRVENNIAKFDKKLGAITYN